MSATLNFLYDGSSPESLDTSELLETFRQIYRHYECRVQAISPSSTDSTVLSRLGDEVDEYIGQLEQVIVLDRLVCYYLILQKSSMLTYSLTTNSAPFSET